MTDFANIREALWVAARPWSPDVPPGGGFYAIFLKPGLAIQPVKIAADGLLYIGMTRREFTARDHFYPSGGHSGGYTLRRTLAAILKDQLSLQAQPSALRAGWRHVYGYRFEQRQELALSRWMLANLTIARTPFAGSLVDAEARLILGLQPPLNLTGWLNPQKSRIMSLRRICVWEAEAFRAQALSAA